MKGILNMKKQTLINNNSYRHYNLPIVFPCIVFFGDQWLISDKPVSTMHFHNCIELGYCKKGNGILSVENSDFAFNTGDYSFIPENVAHKSQSVQGTDSNWEYVFFDPYLMFKNILPENILNNLLLRLTDCFGIISKSNDPELHFIANCIFSELHNKMTYYKESVKGLFMTLLMHITRIEDTAKSDNYFEITPSCDNHEITDFTHASHIIPNKNTNNLFKSDFQWLYSAISYIRKNYQNKLVIAEIAEKCCGLSESHFRKKFNETMHISPLDYINHLRIRIACQLIYNNDKAISEIASEVGFTTLSSFNRNFQALLGCSPSEWRKQQIVNDADNKLVEIISIEEEAVKMIFDI